LRRLSFQQKQQEAELAQRKEYALSEAEFRAKLDKMLAEATQQAKTVHSQALAAQATMGTLHDLHTKNAELATRYSLTILAVVASSNSLCAFFSLASRLEQVSTSKSELEQQMAATRIQLEQLTVANHELSLALEQEQMKNLEHLSTLPGLPMPGEPEPSSSQPASDSAGPTDG
jgi:hypothetical protein